MGSDSTQALILRTDFMISNKHAEWRGVRAMELSSDLKRFIAVHIQSLEQFEIILLLSSNPHCWKAGDVYAAVRSNPESVEARLDEFAQNGFLKKTRSPEVQYHYQPADESLARMVFELCEEYQTRPLKVMEQIYTRDPNSQPPMRKGP